MIEEEGLCLQIMFVTAQLLFVIRPWFRVSRDKRSYVTLALVRLPFVIPYRNKNFFLHCQSFVTLSSDTLMMRSLKPPNSHSASHPAAGQCEDLG